MVTFHSSATPSALRSTVSFSLLQDGLLCKLWVNSCHFEANLVWDISLLVAGSNCCRFVVNPGPQIHGSDLLLNVGPLNERTFFFLQVHDLVFGKFEKDLVCPRRLESQGLFSSWK